DRLEIADTLRRIEVITGTGRRRRWSPDTKAAIVAESCAPRASVSEVARRHDISPSLLFLWRRQSRQADAAVTTSRAEPVFVPVQVADIEPDGARSRSAIEIEVGDVLVRVTGRVDGAALRDVLSAVRAMGR
ncbi:IS66-like element accessory protein TnpA, partial [Rhodoplanes sp. SY1]|uniref:IS66-like element accessory protein TnpA n=1 Tax=Rhodoplanes sp. SY1 TaxID=3166646 RepID=UPI0038B5DC24